MLRLFCIPWWSRSWEPTGVSLWAPVLCLSPGLRISKIKQRADLVSACLVRTRSYSLEYPLNGQIGINTIQTWWGNTVFTKTGDWNSVTLKTVPSGMTFGCVSRSFSEIILHFAISIHFPSICFLFFLVPHPEYCGKIADMSCDHFPLLLGHRSGNYQGLPISRGACIISRARREL